MRIFRIGLLAVALPLLFGVAGCTRTPGGAWVGVEDGVAFYTLSDGVYATVACGSLTFSINADQTRYVRLAQFDINGCFQDQDTGFAGCLQEDGGWFGTGTSSCGNWSADYLPDDTRSLDEFVHFFFPFKTSEVPSGVTGATYGSEETNYAISPELLHALLVDGTSTMEWQDDEAIQVTVTIGGQPDLSF